MAVVPSTVVAMVELSQLVGGDDVGCPVGLPSNGVVGAVLLDPVGDIRY